MIFAILDRLSHLIKDRLDLNTAVYIARARARVQRKNLEECEDAGKERRKEISSTTTTTTSEQRNLCIDGGRRCCVPRAIIFVSMNIPRRRERNV